MSKPIWFPFYPNDFLASSKVAIMDAGEIGAYLLLLCHAWASDDCSLPIEDEKLRKLSRFSGDLSTIKTCFFEKRGKLYNERLLSEWRKANTNKDLARASAMKRWHPQGNADAMPTHMPSQCSSPSPSPSQKNRRTKNQEPSSSEKEIPSVSASPHGGEKSEVWNAYSDEYKSRYGVLPIRNAKVNSCLKSFMSRVPEKEAPDIASFYVRHPGAYYVSRGHPVELLLRDAEKIRTEWANNRPITQREAIQSDGKAARGQVWQELIDEAEAKKGTA